MSFCDDKKLLFLHGTLEDDDTIYYINMEGAKPEIKANQICSIKLPVFKKYNNFRIYPKDCIFLYNEDGVFEFTKRFPERGEINYGCKSRKVLKFVESERISNLEFSTDSAKLLICTVVEENRLFRLLTFESHFDDSTSTKDSDVPIMKKLHVFDFSKENYGENKLTHFFKFFVLRVRSEDYIACIQRNAPYKKLIFKIGDGEYKNFGKKVSYALSCIGKGLFWRGNEVWIIDNEQLAKLTLY